MNSPSVSSATRPREYPSETEIAGKHVSTASGKKPGAAASGAKTEHESPPPSQKPNFGVHGATGANPVTHTASIAAAGGLSPAQQSRVDAARDAIAPLRRELQGHGIDASTFALRYASADHQAKTPEQVKSDARYQFMREALTAHPELADAAIAMRTRSLSTEQRDVVSRAAGEAGAGVAKLAAAERAIASLKGLDRSDVGDVREMMSHGTRFGAAVRTERRELARPNVTEPSLDRQIDAAVGRARAQGQACEKLQHAVLAAYRRVPNVSWGAEKVVGAAAAASTVGSLATAGHSGEKAAAVDNAAHAGGLIAGELRDQIGVTQGLYTSFSRDYADYCAASRQYQDALRSQDHESISAAGARMEALVPRMKRTATALASAAKRVGEMDRRFDAAAEHAAIHVAISAVGAGIGAHHTGGDFGADVTFTDGALHLSAESVVNHAVSKVRH